MNVLNRWSRTADMKRHLADLRAGTYEGAESREEKERLFGEAVRLCTPIAIDVLETFNRVLLAGTGRVEVAPTAEDEKRGLTAGWNLTWPGLSSGVNRFSGDPLEPVRLIVVFPFGWVHPHIAIPGPGFPERALAWPLQVRSEADAERQELIFAAIAEAELHERIYQARTNWRIIPSPSKGEDSGAPH